MNSLMSYGSDDDSSNDTPPDTRTSSPARKEKDPAKGRAVDANLDEVHMELSEEEGGSAPAPSSSKSDRSKRRSERKKDHKRRRSGERRDRHSGRKRKRSRSRERRRRSPTPPPKRENRSRSKDKEARVSKRYERTNNKMDRLDKMGIEIKTPDCQFVKPSDLQKSMNEQQLAGNPVDKNRFFMPGITGRFRDQIERRKLLWQKKEPEVVKAVAAPQQLVPGSSRSTKVWESTTFAQDADGKVASKFKRLMGIRNPGEAGGSAGDVLKKQEEMFSSMEQQYEVARTATHTMRGVGLGFGSFQR